MNCGGIRPTTKAAGKQKLSDGENSTPQRKKQRLQQDTQIINATEQRLQQVIGNFETICKEVVLFDGIKDWCAAALSSGQEAAVTGGDRKAAVLFASQQSKTHGCTCMRAHVCVVVCA